MNIDYYNAEYRQLRKELDPFSARRDRSLLLFLYEGEQLGHCYYAEVTQTFFVCIYNQPLLEALQNQSERFMNFIFSLTSQTSALAIHVVNQHFDYDGAIHVKGQYRNGTFFSLSEKGQWMVQTIVHLNTFLSSFGQDDPLYEVKCYEHFIELYYKEISVVLHNVTEQGYVRVAFNKPVDISIYDEGFVELLKKAITEEAERLQLKQVFKQAPKYFFSKYTPLIGKDRSQLAYNALSLHYEHEEIELEAKNGTMPNSFGQNVLSDFFWIFPFKHHVVYIRNFNEVQLLDSLDEARSLYLDACQKSLEVNFSEAFRH